MTQSLSPPKKAQSIFQILESDVKELITLFNFKPLRLTADKKESILFGSTESKHMSVTIDAQMIKEKTEVKYLGVTSYFWLKNHLSIQVKKIFTMNGTRYKISLYITELCSWNIQKTPSNSLVISHLKCPAKLLCSLSQALITTLKKQLSWPVKACYIRRKFDSSHDLTLINKILPVHMLVQYSVALYTRQVSNYRK